MAGGGTRKDESQVIKNSNVFAALGSLKKKKKSTSKDEGSSKTKGSAAKKPEKEVFWAPAPITMKSWADVDDEDDDDYYATTAPPQAAWGAPDSKAEKESEPHVEGSESEDEGVDEVDDVDEEHDDEPEPVVGLQPVSKTLHEPSSLQKETEKQLSKKELKKKGLEELDAVLAEFGYTKKEANAQDESNSVAEEKKMENKGEMKKDNGVGERKSGKKKKKKEKCAKQTKERADDEFDGAADVGNGRDEVGEIEKGDVKEKLKKMGSVKKKKSSKEMDAGGRAAAIEAAARSARLAAAKKKEKNHYNQQPVR